MIKTIKRSDGYVKRELIINFVFTIAFTAITPVITKLSGLELTVAIIGMIGILGKGAGLMTFIVKDVPMFMKHKLLLTAMLIQILSLASYTMLNDNIWVIIINISDILLSFWVSAFFVDYDAILSSRLSPREFRDLQHVERFVFNGAAIIGISLGSILSAYGYWVPILLSFSISVMVLFLRIIQHTKYYKKITV